MGNGGGSQVICWRTAYTQFDGRAASACRVECHVAKLSTYLRCSFVETSNNKVHPFHTTSNQLRSPQVAPASKNLKQKGFACRNLRNERFRCFPNSKNKDFT